MRILVIILLVSVSTLVFSKGAAGTYHMKGIAYAADKSILKNTELRVKIGDKVQKVMTDSLGNYDIEVRWATACPSGLTPAQRRRETDRINPDHIFISYAGKELKIKNDWEKYAYRNTTEKDPVKKEDLHFA